MAIHDLAKKETPEGAVTAVWYDSTEGNFVVQHEFVHLSFYKDSFEVFLACLNEAHRKYRENHHGSGQ